MLKNVNLLQNPKDITFDKYSEQYVLEALANLGQRIGIKGDGISYRSFTFSEIIGEHYNYSADSEIGYIRYSKNKDNNQYKAIFGVVDKNTLTNYNDLTESINIDDCLYFPNDLVFDIPIGGVDKYSRNSICINNGSELTFMLATRQLGTNDDDKLNTTLYYYKFDIETNKLKYAAKLFHYNTINSNEEVFCLINTVNKLYEKNNYKTNELSNEYSMHVHLFNAKYLKNKNSNYYYDSFIKLFNFRSYYGNNDITFSIIKSEYDNLEYLLHYEEDNDSNSAIAIILNSLQDSLYLSRTLSLKYDTNKNELFSMSETNNNDYIEYFRQEYNINLTEELYILNEEIVNLYYNIFNYYNNKFYLETRAEFIKRILLKLYENITERNYESENILYIPLTYQFSYTCNSNNSLNIYNSSNFYVTYTQIDKLDLKDFWENNTNLIYDYAGIDKVKCYNFDVNYNRDNELFINSIYIKSIYTMPYINANYNWSINDHDSKIQAIGKDAGNPNIIIINNVNDENTSNSYYILNAISNKQHIYNAEYTLRWVNVHPALFENITDTNIQCCAYIPVLTDANIEYFKHSIIFSLSNLDCLSNKDYRYNYKGSYIITIWHIEETEDGKYQFDYIKQVDETDSFTYAVVLGSTVNLLNETSNSSIANLNDQDILLLKAIVTYLGHESLSYSVNNWLIMKNKVSEEYTDNNDSINYSNDLNGIIQYNDNVKIQNNHIVHSQNNKYIKDINTLSITNSLYPKYTKTTEIKTTNEEILTLLKKSQNNGVSATRESKILVDGNLITNAESLIEKLENKYDEETLSIAHKLVIETIYKTKSNYNEYIFNDNIPTLDFKEIFNRNFNVLNRVNILSLDSQGALYNAYIGTSYDENQKSVLHIGTTNKNINVGTDTLMNEVDTSSFATHNTLSLDFDKIILNAKNNITSLQNIVYQKSLNNITYNILTIPLIGTYIKGNVNGIKDNIKNTDNMFIDIYNVNDFNISYYTGNNPTYVISVNYLMKTYFNKSIDNIKNVKINLADDSIFGYFYDIVTNKYYYIIALNKSLYEKINKISTDVLYCNFNMTIMYYESLNNGEEYINIYISTSNSSTATNNQNEIISNYYWYIGPENSSSISNIQTDNTKLGWHEINSMSGFSLNFSRTNAIEFDIQTQYYVIIPNSLHIYAADGNTIMEGRTFTNVTCSLLGYKAFQYKSAVWDVKGLIIKE